MELSESQEQHREWLIGLILSANSPAEIETTRQKLEGWLQQHPDDVGLTDGFDHLAMSRLLSEEQEPARARAA